MKAILKALICLMITLTSCEKGYVDPIGTEDLPEATIVQQINGVEYRGYELSYVQREFTANGNFRIVALTNTNTYTVWFGVNPSRVTVTGISNSLNVPAVFLEYSNGVWTGNFILQLPANYQYTIYTN